MSKTRFILHGGYSSKNNELNRKFYKSLLEELPNPATLTCVYFARDEAIWDELLKDEKRLCKIVDPNRQLKFMVATRENFESSISAADAIFIRGGDTPVLERALKGYPKLSKLFQGKTVAGSSAGAQFLSSHYYSRSRQGIFDGSSVLPINVFCHYQSEGENHSAELALLKQRYPELETVVLRDYESAVRTVELPEKM